MMNNKITITFDKSQEDIPVLMITRENPFSPFSGCPSMDVLNTITGDRATELWNELRNESKEVIKNE